MSLKEKCLECKELRAKVEEMRAPIKNSSVPVASELHSDLLSILSGQSLDSFPMIKIFWQQHQKPMACCNARQMSAYDAFQNVLSLPSRRRLRYYKNVIRPQAGFSPQVITELKSQTKAFSGIQRYIVLLFDEMKIQSNLQHSGLMSLKSNEGMRPSLKPLTGVFSTSYARYILQAYSNSISSSVLFLPDTIVHITPTSHVPDHCSTLALSTPKEDSFRVTCDHSHDNCCPSCDQLKSIIMDIESSLQFSEMTDEDHDDLMYTFQQACQAIESWKAHQVRSIQQDKARTSLLENLETSSVLITQDWAMKFNIQHK
ncbi:hypothetical protein P5673_030190 [Acropora cervicornis]|uniref:Uncharacterized protein n=1 Tax=Acropora cervicornis TaxID=6130 RepID=A0AAD9UTT0_ACRCE|nr:hypothetical protein P5673_030190 [Acropora cervicornis]